MAKEKAKPWFSIKKEHLFLFVIIAAALAAFNYSPDQLPVVGDDYTIIDNAIAAQDLSMCDGIEPEQVKLNCKSRVIIAMQAPEKCVELPGDKADNCFQSIALDTKSYIVCSAIESIEKRDRCYRDVAFSTKDMWPCLNITDPDQRDYCLWDWSGLMDALDGCDRIKSNYLADLCYWRHATFMGHPGACDWVKMPGVKEKCNTESTMTLAGLEVNICSPANCEACSKEECDRTVGCDPVFVHPLGEEPEYGGCGPMEL